MTCKKCGELLDDHVKFCTNCGAKQEEDVPAEEKTILNPTHSRAEDCAHEAHGAGGSESVSFFEAFKLFFIRYADFKGRSRRSEYWWANLAIGLLGGAISTISSDLSSLWSLAIFLPSLAISIRRLHDIGRSGWWYLINLIPVAGQIISIIWACQDSGPDNQWGPNPKA